MIRSVGNKLTKAVLEGKHTKRFGADLVRPAQRRLALLDAAVVLVEKLAKDRRGQHSIRINDQWRICFRWTPAGPEEVEIVDYH